MRIDCEVYPNHLAYTALYMFLVARKISMVTNDATILRIKHDVLCEVAKLAWEGKLEEEREELPYKMFPGPQAQFRCCIYKEREIIKQRVRLAEGKCPTGKDSIRTMWCRS